MLVQARKTEPRLFGTVDSAMKLLHQAGVRRIVLERLEQCTPSNRMCRVEVGLTVLKALTRAAEYDRWVRAKVEPAAPIPAPPLRMTNGSASARRSWPQRKVIAGDKAAWSCASWRIGSPP